MYNYTKSIKLAIKPISPLLQSFNDNSFVIISVSNCDVLKFLILLNNNFVSKIYLLRYKGRFQSKRLPERFITELPMKGIKLR